MGLDGTWYNELGSKMTLSAGGDGSLTGVYASGVGAAGRYDLVGRYDAASAVEDSVVTGWVVQWANDSNNSHSLTSWSGQYQLDEGRNEEIVTLWLLTMQEEAEDDWQSTLVGKDVFTRTQPNDDEVRNAMRKTARSHPKGA